MEGYFYLGRILKLFASKGALLVNLDADNPEDYINLESVFVRMNEQLIPFFIIDIQLRHNNNAVFTFMDIDSPEQASLLTGCELYLPVAMLPPLTGNRFYYHEIKGWRVVDEVFGDTGIVEEVLEYPHQAILRIMRGEKEILVPVSDDIITGVDRDNRTLSIHAPEGLIELYLE
ncbi:ribosome maturation factor RimM [Lentimicrobium sp.]|uniref:ribosome maturation factor RimM n=1 Tax=Lentimicrobium sp. TaxID=2034841 RepID=UPI00345EC4A0